MKKLLFIEDTLDNKIAFYHLALFAATLPFDRIYSELALISLFIHTLIHLKNSRLTFSVTKTALLPVSIYLLTCLGTIYSPKISQAFFEWQIQLSILLFPVIVVLTNLDINKYIINLLFILGLSCVCTVLYLFLNALTVISYHHLPVNTIFSAAFINQNFTLPIDLHATYFSMYIALSITVIIHLLTLAVKKGQKMFLSICLIVLFAGVLPLSSRSVLISLFIIISFLIPFIYLKKNRRIRFISFSVVISAIALAFITANHTFHTRYITDLKEDLTESVINNNLLEPRAVRWACAFELIKASPVTGYGTGSEVFLLKDVYFRHHYYSAYINELNAHNQYLSIWIKTGIFGLLIYLLVLYKGFYKAVQQRNLFFCAFMVLITITGFAENILDVNKGIFFFACFFSLFYIGKVNGSASRF